MMADSDGFFFTTVTSSGRSWSRFFYKGKVVLFKTSQSCVSYDFRAVLEMNTVAINKGSTIGAKHTSQKQKMGEASSSSQHI